MKKILKQALYATALIGALTACGDDEEEDASESLSKGQVEGTWVGACRAVNSLYSKRQYAFDGNFVTFRSGKYNDDACTDEIDYILGTGTFDLVGDTSDDDGKRVAMADFKFVSFSWTFVEDSSAAVDWGVACDDAPVSGGTVNVLGKTCTVGTFNLNFAAEQFGSMIISAGDLYATDVNSNGATEEERSTAINWETGALVKLEVAAEE